MARKAKGNEVKSTRSVRIEPKKRDLIAKRHGTFQQWIDKQVEKEIALIKGTKAPRPIAQEKLSPKVKTKLKKMVDEMF